MWQIYYTHKYALSKYFILNARWFFAILLKSDTKIKISLKRVTRFLFYSFELSFCYCFTRVQRNSIYFIIGIIINKISILENEGIVF